MLERFVHGPVKQHEVLPLAKVRSEQPVLGVLFGIEKLRLALVSNDGAAVDWARM
jgi:hypothetical protein